MIGLYEEHADRMQKILVHLRKKVREEKEDREAMIAEMREQIREEVRQELSQNGRASRN